LTGPNVNITNKSGAQSETTIAVDPTSPRHLMATANDLSQSTGPPVYESFDGGKTWANAGLTLTSFCYDPWLAFNTAGDVFFSYECSDERIAYRKHGTSTWVPFTLQNSSLFPDRDMDVVDRTSTSPFFGSVYVGYDEANSGNAAHVWYSRDGFGSWTKSPKINDTSATIGNNVAVGPDGTIYATWEDYNGKKLWTDKSTDGGATWGTDHVVTNFRINTQSFFIFIPPQPNRGVLPMPFSATAPAGTPNAGRLYVTYFDKDPVGSNTNIYVRHSDDGGATWSAETKVDDDTNSAYHFHPRIAVSPNGTVAVAFYDTRNDSTNKKTDTYISFSTDGGVTWSANQKITTAMSDESGFGDPNDYGDYQGIDASPANWFAISWTDSRIPGAVAEDLFGAKAKA